MGGFIDQPQFQVKKKVRLPLIKKKSLSKCDEYRCRNAVQESISVKMKVCEGLTTLNVCLCVFQVSMSAFVDLQLQLSSVAQQELQK